MDGMPDALELYRRLVEHMDGALPFQVVTLDGRVLRARGEMSSTQSADRGGSLLARESELRTLTESWERARDGLAAAKQSVAALESSRKSLSGEVAEASARAAQIQGEIGKRGAETAELSSQVAKVEAAIEWHRSRGSNLEREEAQVRESLARVERELSEVESRGASVRGRLEQLQSDLAEEQSRVSEVSARRSRLQSELSGFQNRLRETGARVAAVSESLHRATGRVDRQRERTSQLAEAIAQVSHSPHLLFSPDEKQELEAAEVLVTASSARIIALREESESAEKEVAASTRSLEAAREELADARSRVHESSTELAALLREAVRESEMEWDGVPSPQAASQVVDRLEGLLAGEAAQGLPDTLAAALQRADALRQQVAALGTINAEAPEEYRQVSERDAFLSDQIEDLRRAERTLRGGIEELRRAMEERFQSTFERVNEEFGRYFSILFGGGSARLVLTRPEDPLEGGVDVAATPPGKKTSSLLGLSGGERALTAISLLFAMMKVNPSPFCVLDEVDAALDESNVRRFCSVLQDLAANTQFLVITHNRTTMEMAGALYGVSMLSESVSAVMSVRLAAKESQT